MINSVDSKKSKIKKKIAQIFFAISLLADIIFAFSWMIISGNSYGNGPLIAAFLFILPFFTVKFVTILLGHFRHNDWQFDYKKFFTYRMRIVLSIIITDIISILVLGAVSRISGVSYLADFSGNAPQISYDAVKIMLEMLMCFGIISGPAIILGTVVSFIDARRMRNHKIASEKTKAVIWFLLVLLLMANILVWFSYSHP